MPIYSIKGPDGKTYSLEGPAGATREQVIQEVKLQQYKQLTSGSANQQREGTAGFFEGIVGGTKNILSGSQTAVEAPFISGEEAALRGIERQKGRTERPGFSLDEITKTYEQDGLFSAAGETLSQIPGAIGEQLPFLASMKAGFAAGAALPLPPQAKLLAGIAGSLLTPFLVSSGSAMERKASEQLKRGDKVDINELGAYGTGLASAGLERAALGLSGLSKVMGIDFLKGAGTETAEQIARRSLAATLARGGGKLVAAEVPTEMGQQALERYYAGLSLTDEEAMREYAEAGAGAAMLAPLGMAGSAYQRRQVRKDIEKREAEKQRDINEKKQKEEAELKRKEEAKEITETAAKLERQRIEQEAQERKDAIEAELQRARETGEPVKSIQQIINEMTGVVQDPLDEKQLADIAKIDTERDRVFSQLRANRDLGAITEDEYKGKLLFLDEQVSKAKKELSQKQVKERKPLTGKKLTARQKQFQEGLDEPSGEFVAGVDGIERQLTEAETQGIPVQKYDPTKQKLTKEFITTKKGLGVPTGIVPKNLTGLDPTNVEDNKIIRVTLEANLETKRKNLENSESLEVQQKRQEVITKIETYLTALPTTQELENADYQKTFDAEAAGRSYEVDDGTVDPADTLLSSINVTGGVDQSGAISNESDGRAGQVPPPLAGTLTREELDAKQLEETNKEMEKKEKEIKTKENEAKKGKNRTLRSFLHKTKLPRSDMDIMGETSGKSGYMSVFDGEKKLTPSLSLMSLIEGGRVDKFLPPDLRLEADRAVDTAFDAEPAYDYLAERMRNQQEVIEYDIANDIEQEQLFLNNMEESVAKATGATATPQTTAPAAATQESTTEATATPKTYTFEGKPIPQKLIDQYRKMVENDKASDGYTSYGKGSQRSGTTIANNFLKQAQEFLGGDVITLTRGREFTNLLNRINRPGQSATVPISVDGKVRVNDQGKQDPRDAANFEDVQETQPAATPTQESTTETEAIVPTFEGKEIPQSLINSFIQSERATSKAENAGTSQSKSAATRLFSKIEKEMEDFLGLTYEQQGAEQRRVVKLRYAIENVLKGEPIGYDKFSYKKLGNTVDYKIDRSLIDKAKEDGFFFLSPQSDYLGTKDVKPAQDNIQESTTEVYDEIAGTYLGEKVLPEEKTLMDKIIKYFTDKLNSKDYITQQEFQDLMAADLYSESNMNRQQTRRGYSLFMDKILDEVKQLPANKSPLFLQPNNEGFQNRVPFEVIAGRIAKQKAQPIQESRTETEQDKLAFELREAEYQAGSYIKASERVPKRLRDRIKKLKEQLSVQESRSDTLGPVETADSITESLRKEFGSDIDKAIDSGQLVIVNNLSELPNNFNFAPTANGAYDPTSNKVYIVASKVMPGQGRKVLLHELGEHYGLERMLGDSYGATLGRLNSLKNTDPAVRAIWDEVGRKYPDLEVGGKLYLQEVMAKIGEQSPQNTLFKRVVAAVKNFLRKLGFFNPNTLTTADMQDLVMYSTRSALAKSDKVTASQLAAGQMQMQFSKEELKTIAGWSEKRQRAFFNDPSFDNENAWDSRVMYFVTMMSPQQFLDLASPISVEQMDTSIDKKFNTGKGESGLKNELLKWDSELSIEGATAGLGRQPYLSIRDSKIVGHEGRHRARALQRLGIKQFPVVIEGKRGSIFDTEATYRDPAAKDISFDSMEVTAQGRSTKETIGKMVGISKNNRPELRAMVDTATNPEMSQDIMFSKTDVPAGLEQTSVYLSGVKDDSKTFYNNFVGPGLDKLINQPVDTLASLWNQGRVKMAYSGAGIERKLVNEFEGAVTKEGVGVRGDIIMSQALDDSVIASQSAAEGKVVLGEDRVARVVVDENNINNLVKLRQQLADQTSIEFAEGLIQSYTSARRYRLELDRVERRAANIASLNKSLSETRQELKTAKGKDRRAKEALMDKYKKEISRDTKKNESINITPEQEAAIEPGLAYAQQYPVLVEVGAMIDAINKNRIDLLEQSGVYTKDMADDYRDREGYVPLFREMIEDLGKGDQTITQYFSGFADIGKEYGFTGSDRDTKHVLGNLLQQHFWAVSASLRNNANYEAAKQVGLHNEKGELIKYDKKPETGTAAPVMIDGERKFVEYSDPTLAIGIQGALPVYKGILKWFGLAAKWFRLGITANPVFQTYQVINDALGAAMYSGVKSPLKLGKEIIGGYVKDQYFRDTKAIDDQMARLGIAGGFGRTPGDIFLKAQRQLGVENMNKWQKLVDATDAFASRSDLAQRRGIFVQTLLESGGVRQADGSVAGGNEIEAMNRALNIINWQKRGASSSVRTMTHVIPFANAYLQGMDVLLNAMAGKGLSGTDAQTARILFLKTALSLTMFNMLYSMIVAGEEEYDELDDRIKFRNYIVPGTGFKLPVRAEISLLTKYLPEQAYQYVTKLGTTNEVDATKLFNGMSLAVRDAAMGPNLFPQLIRGSVEVATNYNFYSGRPLIGLGLSRLDTAEQYNEATSELAKLLGSTGMVAPINADHIIRSYFGTVGSTALFVIDQAANTMIGNEKPAMRLKDFPLISPLLYSAQGRDKLNDFYELKQASDEATATVNRLMKYDPKKAFEYRKDNARMIGTRKQVNRLSNNLKDLRARRKLIIESGMDGDKKRAALTNVEKQMNNVVRSIARLRIASGL